MKYSIKRFILPIVVLSFTPFLVWTKEITPVEKKYPALYGQELPRYPQAKLIDTGRQTKSIKDGLRLKLISPDPVQKIAKYYEKEMLKLGWKIPKQRFLNPKIYISKYTKGNLYFQITIIRAKPDSAKTDITIVYAEN